MSISLRFYVSVCMSVLACALAQLPIDNGIVGDPEVECLAHTMSIKFVTKSPFQGHVFVRGHYHEDECHKDYIMNQEGGGFMDVAFEKCGMRRQRETNPKGMTMSATLVVSFHRTFITQVDKAYHIECFYIEEEKMVTQNLEVSQLPTTDLGMPPQPMPTCKYEVLSDGPDGAAMSFARVGDKVYHKWSCEYDLPEMYCMVIHSCEVDDGDKEVYEVIDQNGCAKDPVILDDLSYITDLMAGTEASIFRFADKARVFFSCQVRLSLKHEEPGEVCPRPKCDAPSRRFRFRRDTDLVPKLKQLLPKSRNSSNDFDLIATPILVLDLDDVARPKNTDSQAAPKTPSVYHRLPLVPALLSPNDGPNNGGVCLSETSFGILMAAALLSCLSAILFATFYCIRNRLLFKA